MTKLKVKVIQVVLLLSVVALVPVRAHTVALKCDPDECSALCQDNEVNCDAQHGTITDDCTGDCVNGSCDDKLTCRLPL
jgi:hypothetical protein